LIRQNHSDLPQGRRWSGLLRWEYRKDFFDKFVREADVVMIGDSITEFAEWSDMFPGIRIANRGIGGETTEGVLKRIPGIHAVNAKKAFLMLGINDLSSNKSDPKRVFERYSHIVKLLLARNMRVYVQSTILCNPRKAKPCAAVLPKLKTLNNSLSRLAAPNVIFIDLNAELSDETGLKDEFTDDGVHINSAGYAAWKLLLSKFIGPS